MDLTIMDGNGDGVTIQAAANEDDEYSTADRLCEVRIYSPAVQSDDGVEEEPAEDLMIALSLEGAEALADALMRWAARRRAVGATG